MELSGMTRNLPGNRDSVLGDLSSCVVRDDRKVWGSLSRASLPSRQAGIEDDKNPIKIRFRDCIKLYTQIQIERKRKNEY